MFTRLYIEALLVDEEAADAVWEAWDKGVLSDLEAAVAWRKIALSDGIAIESSRLGNMD